MPLPLTCTQGNMKEQTMNVTKCEIPQPLSRSHFPGSCWGSRKDRSSINSLWEESCAISSQAIYLHLVSLSLMEALSFLNVSERQKDWEKIKNNKSSNCEVNLISSTETIKRNLQWIMPRMNYLSSSRVGHLSCRHIHVFHHSSNDPRSRESCVTGK